MSLKKYQNINLKKAREQGFTIVELLIVIIVIAILAALVISAYSGIQAQARESAAKQKAKEAEKALVAYYNEWTKWPDSLGDLRSGNSINIDTSNINIAEGKIDTSNAFIILCPEDNPTGAAITYISAGISLDDAVAATNSLVGNAKLLGEATDAMTCLSGS